MKHPKLDLPPYRGEVADVFASPESLAVLRDPRSLLKRPGAEILIDGRNTVAAVTVDLGPEAPVEIVVKEFHSRGIDKFKSLLRKSKAEKAWRGARALAEAGFGTPAPIAYLERRKRGFVEESYFLSKRIRGATEVRGLFRNGPEDVLSPLLSALARALSRSHDRGILHGDLSDGNVLVRRDGESFELFFLDTNRIRLRRRIGGWGRAKSLVRLGIPPGLRSFFLGEYAVAAGRGLRKSFVFGYKLNKAAFTAWLKTKKALRLKKIARALRIQ